MVIDIFTARDRGAIAALCGAYPLIRVGPPGSDFSFTRFTGLYRHKYT